MPAVQSAPGKGGRPGLASKNGQQRLPRSSPLRGRRGWVTALSGQSRQGV